MLEYSNTIYYGYEGQVYDYLPGGSLSYLTASSQHQYRNEGEVHIPQYKTALSKQYDSLSYDEYCMTLSKYRDEPLCLYDPNRKSNLKKKKKELFRDDDWSVPLYQPDTIMKVSDEDKMECDPEVMSMQDCVDWIEQYGKRKASRARELSMLIDKRMDELLLQDRRKKVLKKQCSKFVTSMYEMGLNAGLCRLLERMYMNQNQWWESKQIKR